MAHPADDGRSVSSRIASSSNTSNTSTLPKVTGIAIIHRNNEVISPNSSMTCVAGQVTRPPPLQSQLQVAVPQQQPTATSRLSDLRTIPEGIVQATASVYCSLSSFLNDKGCSLLF
eukprot:1204501-Amphidinium_carterae.1